MKISKIFATCVFAATFVSSASAFANDSNFYSGEYVCDGKVKFTDWELSKLNDREYSAVIYHGTRGENQYMEYKLDGVVEDNKLSIFYNKRPFIVARLTDADTE